jgi:putative heme-binding domain-containing protein
LLRHPEWGEAGAAFLRQLVENSNPTETDRQSLDQFLPRFATNPAVAAAIADSLRTTKRVADENHRTQLLEGLAALDLGPASAALGQAIIQCLHDPNTAVALAAIRATAALRLPRAEEPLAALVTDSACNASVRLEAMRELVRRRQLLDSTQMDFLLAQLAETKVPMARLAAAEVLTNAKLNSGQIAALLKVLRNDAVISPGYVLSAVERNGLEPDLGLPVLDYLAAKFDAGWTIPSEQLDRIMAVVPPSQRSAADTLVARLNETIARQRRQLTDFVPLLNGGDFVRGEKIFYDKGQCVTCHRIWENGGRVGPDLSRVGAIRSGHDILESLLIPSATIAQGYETLNVTTTDGETYTGIRVGSSEDPLHLRLASGTDMVLHQNQIKSVDHSKVSLMPEGLLNQLSREEVRDLLAFLQHLK